MKFTQIATAIALGLALSTAAQAATATDTFNVKITITGTCDAAAFAANTPADVDFGSHVAAATSAALAPATNGATGLSVRCSKNLPVTVGLTPSNANTAGAGNMTDPVSTNTIAYTLTQPTGGPTGPFTSASVTAWGDVTGAGANVLAVTGNGLAASDAINLPVTANVAANLLNVSAGVYNDVVTATLTY